MLYIEYYSRSSLPLRYFPSVGAKHQAYSGLSATFSILTFIIAPIYSIRNVKNVNDDWYWTINRRTSKKVYWLAFFYKDCVTKWEMKRNLLDSCENFARAKLKSKMTNCWVFRMLNFEKPSNTRWNMTTSTLIGSFTIPNVQTHAYKSLALHWTSNVVARDGGINLLTLVVVGHRYDTFFLLHWNICIYIYRWPTPL